MAARQLAGGVSVEDPCVEVLMYLAARAWGWTPEQVLDAEYGTVRGLLMMHAEYEGVVAQRMRAAQGARGRGR